MNRAELVAEFRRRARDEAGPPFLWNEDEIQLYLDEANDEAAERSSLIRDSITPEICEVVIEAGNTWFELDDRILQVRRAKLDSQTRPLRITTKEAIDLDWDGWEDQPAGEPRLLVVDAEGAGWSARLVPPPSAEEVMRLEVNRLPLGPLLKDSDEPEFSRRLHLALVDWMLHKAYSKKDAETYNPAKASEHAADFASVFGERRDVRTNRVDHDSLHPVVRPMGL